MFRVIIAGSRDFSDYQFLCEKMDNLGSTTHNYLVDSDLKESETLMA